MTIVWIFAEKGEFYSLRNKGAVVIHMSGLFPMEIYADVWYEYRVEYPKGVFGVGRTVVMGDHVKFKDRRR